MLQYLINVTHTLLPAFLVLALLCCLIRKRQAFPAKRCLLCGALAGGLVAVVLAVLRLTTGFVIRELYNAPLLLLMILAEVLLLFCLLSSRKNPDFPAGKRAGMMFFVSGFAWLAFILPDMVLYPFEFAVGMESICNLAFLGRIVGYFVALVLTCLAALSLFRLSAHYGDRLFRRIFFMAVAIFASWHVLLFLQIAVLRRWVPDFSWLVELVMWSLQYQKVFLLGLLLLSIFAAVCSIHASRSTVIGGENPALRRKQKIDARRQLRWAVALLLNAAIIFFAQTVGVQINEQSVELAPPVELTAEAGRVAIPVEKVSDGHLHRFGYTAEDGTQMRYIVIKKGEGSFGVGLDACDVCGPSGYYERDGQIVCILCDVVINISTIGFKGGCNPVPLEYVLQDGHLVIKTADLESEAHRFR